MITLKTETPGYTQDQQSYEKIRTKSSEDSIPHIAFYLQDIWADSAGEEICAAQFDCFLTAVKDMEFVT